MSAEGWQHGKELRVDFGNLPSVEFHVQPDLKDIDGIYLWGWYSENCNTPVIKIKLEVDGVDMHDVFNAVARYNGATGAAIGGSFFTDVTPIVNLVNNDFGGSNPPVTPVSTHVPISAHDNAVTIYPGLVAQQGVLQQFQAPKLLTDHKQHIRGINKLKFTALTLTGAATVTFDRLVLDLRCSEANPAYINPGNRGLRF